MIYYGIYKIINLINGKMYIGKHITNNLDDGYMGSGIWIKRSIKKHGLQNFKKEWLMFCEDEDELNYMERVYVDQTWVDRSDTYNLSLGGKGCIHQVTEETRKKMSESKKGKLCGEKNGMYGKRHTDESLKKMSLSRKGKGNGHVPWDKGKKLSEETRQKMREAKRNMSEETRQKMSSAIKNRNVNNHWFNNGIKNVFCKECPEGFVFGRLNWKNK